MFSTSPQQGRQAYSRSSCNRERKEREEDEAVVQNGPQWTVANRDRLRSGPKTRVRAPTRIVP